MHLPRFAVLVVAAGCGSEQVGDKVSEIHLYPPVRIANQNGFYSGVPTCNAGKNVAVVGGEWFLQCDTSACPGQSTEYDTFVSRTKAQVECSLSDFLSRHQAEFDAFPDNGTGCRETTGGLIVANCPTSGNGTLQCWQSRRTAIIIMDIEQPHPMDLRTYVNINIRKKVENAYKTRILAAKNVFPSAGIGLYGTLVPQSRGIRTLGTYQDSYDKLEDAAGRGLFANLDYLVPVLYPRFGCEANVPYDTCTPAPNDGSCDAQLEWESYAAYTDLGIKDSNRLAPGKEQLPLITTAVHNGNSCFDPTGGPRGGVHLFDMFWHSDPVIGADIVWDQTLGVQLQKIDELDADATLSVNIRAAVLWTPDDAPVGDDDAVLPQPNDGGWTVNDYTNRLCD